MRSLCEKSFSTALLAVMMLAGTTGAAQAQSQCEEPAESAYVERMDLASQALDVGDYETALSHIQWALDRYDYAILDYAQARGLHRLGRYAEAEQAYSRFLRRFADCPDPSGIATMADEYRRLAIREQMQTLESHETELVQPDEIEVAELDETEVSAYDEIGLIEDEFPEESQPINPGWIVLGAGGVSIVTGLIYDVANWHLVDDKEAADQAGDHDEFYRIQGEIEDAQTIEWIFFGTGLAAVTTGVILLLLDDQPSDPEVEVGLSPSTTGGAFSLSFDF